MATQAPRRLAAILFTDVVGSTAVTARSEAEGMQVRDRHRDLVRTEVARYGGTFVEAPGDESLSAFESALDAAHCALALREAVESEPELRLTLGIHLGETVYREREVFGDGVNIAARVRELAEPDEILVSGEVAHAIRNQPHLETEPRGEHKLKNVGRPVSVFALTGSVPDGASAAEPGRVSRVGSRRSASGWVIASVGALVVIGLGIWSLYPPVEPQGTDRVDPPVRQPAIAVLPFDNLSGDPEQEYFSEGLNADLTSRLSGFHGLTVIARNSAFAYKGQAVDARQVSAELGARYLLQGSVRRAGDRIRINARLVDASAGHQVWAQTYDRELTDVLALQDDITRSIAVAMHPELLQAETERAVRRDPESVDALDLFYRGFWHFNKFNREDHARARENFERAIELEPAWGPPHSGLALTQYLAVAWGWADSVAESTAKAIEAAHTAIELDPDDPLAHHALAHAYSLEGDRERMISALERSMDPADATGAACSGVHLAMAGRSEQALAVLEEAIRLSPRDPVMPTYYKGIGYAHFAAGRYDEAASWARRVLEQPASFEDAPAFRLLAASYAHLGQLDEGHTAAGQAARLNPDFSPAQFRSSHTAYDPDFIDAYLGGLERAALAD